MGTHTNTSPRYKSKMNIINAIDYKNQQDAPSRVLAPALATLIATSTTDSIPTNQKLIEDNLTTEADLSNLKDLLWKAQESTRQDIARNIRMMDSEHDEEQRQKRLDFDGFLTRHANILQNLYATTMIDPAEDVLKAIIDSPIMILLGEKPEEEKPEKITEGGSGLSGIWSSFANCMGQALNALSGPRVQVFRNDPDKFTGLLPCQLDSDTETVEYILKQVQEQIIRQKRRPPIRFTGLGYQRHIKTVDHYMDQVEGTKAMLKKIAAGEKHPSFIGSEQYYKIGDDAQDRWFVQAHDLVAELELIENELIENEKVRKNVKDQVLDLNDTLGKQKKFQDVAEKLFRDLFRPYHEEVKRRLYALENPTREDVANYGSQVQLVEKWRLDVTVAINFVTAAGDPLQPIDSAIAFAHKNLNIAAQEFKDGFLAILENFPQSVEEGKGAKNVLNRRVK